jgi:hypothetical protein
VAVVGAVVALVAVAAAVIQVVAVADLRTQLQANLLANARRSLRPN